MSRTATMNIRLKVLLINFAISGLINIVTRYLSIAWYLSESIWFPENGMWYQIIFRLHDLCVVMLTINPVVIAIERISATIFSKSYEDFNNTICNYTLRLSSVGYLLIARIFKRTTAKISTNNPKNVFGKDIIIHNANHDNIGMLQDMWK
uniref:G_PROTEIN_RECEP_F1_2 domain-containing protein n=1 Tax=Strongyloides papillosus TaxID=174720 RepID=A0A0N5BH50_STREA